MKQRSIREINELELRKLETASGARSFAESSTNLKAIATKQQELLTATSAAELNAKIVQENLAGAWPRNMNMTHGKHFARHESAVSTLAFQQKLALAEWDRTTGRYFQFSDDTARNCISCRR